MDFFDGHSIDSRMFSPVDPSAENGFENEVIGSGGTADADTEIDLPDG